jgi:hypothetical protein
MEPSIPATPALAYQGEGGLKVPRRREYPGVPGFAGWKALCSCGIRALLDCLRWHQTYS